MHDFESVKMKIVKGCAFDTEDKFIERSVKTVINNKWYLESYEKNLMPYVKGRVLEAGCGIGALAPLFGKGKYTGLDISQKFIDFARKQYPGYKFVVADLTKKLPFKDKEFDTAIILWALHHIKNWKFALSELKRVSKRVVIGEITYKHKQFKLIFSLFFFVINRFTYIRFFTEEELGKGIVPTSKNPTASASEKILSKIKLIFFVPKIFIIGCSDV